MMSQTGLYRFYHTKPFVFRLITTVPRVDIYHMATFNCYKQIAITSKLTPAREYLSRNRKDAHGTVLPP